MNYFNQELKFGIVKDNYLRFCKEFLFPYLETPYQEEDYYQIWNEMINNRDLTDKHDRVMLRWLEEISRGHSKTLMLNIFLTIYDAVSYKYPTQAIGGATNEQTKEFGDNIKRMLLKSPYLKYAFVPDFIASLDEKSGMSAITTQWNRDKIVLKNGAVINFRSLKQEWSGKHFHKITIDDGVAKKEDKLKDSEGIRTFQYDIIPTAKSFNADVLVLGTPVRTKDLIGYVKQLGFFEVHSYPAISNFDKFIKLVNDLFIVHKIDVNDFNSQCKWLMNNQSFTFEKRADIQQEISKLCLSKVRFGWKKYMQTYAEVGRKAFFREFLMEIKESNNSVIGESFIELAKQKGQDIVTTSSRLNSMVEVIHIWDFSFSKSETADKTSCVMAWKDSQYPEKIVYQILWEVRPCDFPEWKKTLLNKMTEFNVKYKPDAIVPEVNSILQLTDDFKGLGLPLKPIWMGSSDSTAKAKLNNKNFVNMITIDKISSIERLSTAFENEQVILVYGDETSRFNQDNLGEQLTSWVYDDNNKITESNLHPDAGICVVMGNEYFRNNKKQKTIIGGFL